MDNSFSSFGRCFDRACCQKRAFVHVAAESSLLGSCASDPLRGIAHKVVGSWRAVGRQVVADPVE